MNLKELIEADGVRLVRVGRTFRGRCPFHDGKTETSLLVDDEAGKFHCFGCDRHGDAIEWLRERRGMTFMEACAFLDREPEPRASRTRPIRPQWKPREAKTPEDAWQEKARAFLDKARRTLWTETGTGARAFLHGRGLQDKTIRAAGLGLNPSDLFLDRKSWGLEPTQKEDGTEKRLWVPAGLVIPFIEEGKVKRLRIRRDESGDGSRYIVISGSSSAPMTWNLEGGAAVIVESELDGILLNQEAGDLAGVVALGTATAKPDGPTHDALNKMEVVLISLDSDEAGAKAAWSFWPETYGTKAKRWPVPIGKDPSDAKKEGLDIRAWVLAGLPDGLEMEGATNCIEPFPAEWLKRFDETILERLAIMTVDGKLSDCEALNYLGLVITT